MLEKIRRDLDEKDVSSGGTNLGIINVHRRIKHLFGGQYGVTIDSSLGEGTQVIVSLPMIVHVSNGEVRNV